MCILSTSNFGLSKTHMNQTDVDERFSLKIITRNVFNYNHANSGSEFFTRKTFVLSHEISADRWWTLLEVEWFQLGKFSLPTMAVETNRLTFTNDYHSCVWIFLKTMVFLVNNYDFDHRIYGISALVTSKIQTNRNSDDSFSILYAWISIGGILVYMKLE